ncbi:DUF5776 domain-containing protein [Apilactobacillus apinorum]|uniref:DUF5776 domain-containing protein n=1 Tax=Apilactobacillus apinorum TaxID=1218495 RepID=UPI0006B5B206|nr:DUF5776 domain-containing protein [Apilactobacillus apinorum]KOY69713.1 hypothetical protein RZ74_02120 [Apilactobacillus apinorum]CAI2623223.1 Hypothetical protein AAPFHON13_02180 [Apilactobacillus apinorum]
MQYNKSEIQKTNDKKILRKVKKQWVVVSLASFAFLGASAMGLMTQNTSAHADTVATASSSNTSQTQTADSASNGQSQSEDSAQSANQSSASPASSDNDNQLTNRDGDAQSTASIQEVKVNLDDTTINNFKQNLYGTQKGSSDQYADYTSSINQGIHDAYAGKVSNTSNLNGTNNQDLYTAAYQGVQADASKTVTQNMTASTNADVQAAASNLNSLLYTAYQYGIDFKKTADLAYNDAIKSKSEDPTTGSNRPAASTNLQPIYDNSYVGTRQALAQQFDSSNNFNTGGYNVSPDATVMPVNNSDSSKNQYQTAYDKAVNNFNNGIVYVNNAAQYQKALYASSTSTVNKIVLTADISSTGSMDNLGNVVVDGQGQYNLSGSYTFNKSNKSNSIIIQNMRGLSTSYTVNGDGFIGYNNVNYNGGFNNLFNPTAGNGNYIIGANVKTSDGSIQNDGSITYNVDFADNNPNGGKIVIGDNAKYNMNSLSANYIVVNQGVQLKLNPVELDNHVYNKNLKGQMIKNEKYLDPAKTPRYAIMANGNISIHQGAVVTLTISNNTNAIRVGNVNKPEDTGSGDSGNVTISGTLNVIVPSGVTPTSLDKRVQYPNSKRTDAVIWLGHGMQVLSGGTFNVDAKISDQSDAGKYYAFVYGPYSNLIKGGTREPSMSQITVLQNGSMIVNMNTGSKTEPIRFAYVPIVAYNPKDFSINLNVTPGSTTGADGVKLSLSSIDVFGAVLDQDTIDSVKTSSGYLVNPYIYHYRRNGTAGGKIDSSMIGNEIFQDINGVTNGYKSSNQYSKDKFSFSYPYTWKLIPNTGVTSNGASFDYALDYLANYVQLYEDIIGYQQSFEEQVGNGNFVTNNTSRASAGAYNPDKNKHGDNPTQDDINNAIKSVWRSDVNKATGIGIFSDSTFNTKSQQAYLNGQTFEQVAGMSMKDFKKALTNISSAVSLKSNIINIANALGQTVSSIAQGNSKVSDTIDKKLGGNNPSIVSGQNSRNDTSINLSGAPSIQFNNNLVTYVDANGYYHAKFNAQMNNQGSDPQSKEVDVHFVTGSFDAGTNGNEDSYQNMYKQSGNKENFAETITLDSSNSTTQSDGSILFSGDVNLGVKQLDTVGIRLNTFLSTGLNSSQGASRQQIASVTSTLRPSNNSYQTNVDGYNSVVDNGGTLLRPTDNNLYSVPSVVKANDFLANISNTLSHLNDADQSEAQYYTNKTSSDPLPEPEYRTFSVNNQNITPFNDSDYSGANAESSLINAKTIRVYAGLGTNKRRLIGVTSVPGDSILANGTVDTSNFSQARDQINILKNNVSTNNKGYVLDLSKTPLTQYDAKTYDVVVPEVQYMQTGAQLSLDTANGSQLPFAGTATVDANGKITQITPNLPGYAIVSNPNGISPDSSGMYTVVPQAGLADVYIDDANGNPTGAVAKQIEVIGNANGGVNATKTTKVPSGKNDGVQYVIDPSTKIGVVTDSNGVQTYHVKLTATLDKTNVNVQTPSGSTVAGGGTRTIDANGNVVTNTNLPGFAPTNTSVSNGKDVVNPSTTPVRTKVTVYDDQGNPVTKNGKPVTADVMVQGQDNGQSIITAVNGRDEFTGDDGKKYKVTPGSAINPIINNTVYSGASVTATVDNTKTSTVTAVTPNGSSIPGGATLVTDQNGNTSSQSNVPGFVGSNPAQKNGNSAVLTPTTSTNVQIPVVNSSTGQQVGTVTVDVQGHDDGTSSITKVDNSTPITDNQGNTYPVDTNSKITIDQNGNPVISVNPVAPQNQNVGAVTPSGNPISAGAVISTTNGQSTSTSNIPGFIGSTPAKQDAKGNAILTPTTTSNVTIEVQDQNGNAIGHVTATVQGNSDGTATIKSIDNPSNGTLIDPENPNNAYVVNPGTQISENASDPTKAVVNIAPTFTGSKNVGAVTDSGSPIQGGATITGNGAGGIQATTVLPGFNTSTEAQLDKNGNAVMTPSNNPVSASVDVYDADTGQKVGTTTISAQGNENGTSNVTAGTTFTNGNDTYIIPQGTNITIQNGNPAVTIKKSNGNYKAGDKVPLRRTDGVLLPFTGIVQNDGSIVPNLPGYNNGSTSTMSNGAFTVAPNTDTSANLSTNIHVVDGISGQDTGKVITATILGSTSTFFPNRLIEIQALSPQQQSGVSATANSDGITANISVLENDGKTTLSYNDTFGNLDNMIQAHDGSGASDSYYYVVLGTPADGSIAPVVTSTGASIGQGIIHSSNTSRPYITPDNPGFTSTSLQKDSTGNNYVVTPTVAQTTLDVHDANGNKVGSVTATVQGHTDGTTTIVSPNAPITITGTDGNTYHVSDGNSVIANQPNTIGKGYNTVGDLVGIGNATITNGGNNTVININNVPVTTDENGNTVVSSNTLSPDGSYIIPAGTKVNMNNGNATIEGLPYDSNSQTATISAHFDHRGQDTGTTGSVKVTVNSDGSMTVKNVASASSDDTIYTTQPDDNVTVTTNANGQNEYHVPSKAQKLTQTFPAQTGSNGPVVKDGITVTVDPLTGNKTITSNVPGFGLDNGQKSMTVPSNVDTSSLILKPITETISGVKNDSNGQTTGSTTDSLTVKGDDKGNISVVTGKASSDNNYFVPANTPVTKSDDGSYHANSLPLNSDGTVTLNNTKYNGQDGSSVTGPIKAHVNSDGTLSTAGGQTQTDNKGNVYVVPDNTPVNIGQNSDGTPAYNVPATKVQQDKQVPAKTGDNGQSVPNGATIHINSDGTQTVQSNVPGYTGDTNLPISQDTSNPTLHPAETTLNNVHADDNQSSDTGKTISSLPVKGDDKGNLVTTQTTYTSDGSQVALPGSPVIKDASGNYHVQTLPIQNGTVTIHDAAIYDDKGNIIDHKDVTATLDPNTGKLTLNQPDGKGVHTIITSNGTAYQADNGTEVIKDGNGYKVVSQVAYVTINNAQLTDTASGNPVVGTGTVNVDTTTGKVLPHADISSLNGKGPDNAGYQIAQDPDKTAQTINWKNPDGSTNENAVVKVTANSPFDYFTPVGFKNAYTKQMLTPEEVGNTTYYIKITHATGLPVYYGTKDVYKSVVNAQGSQGVPALPNNYIYDPNQELYHDNQLGEYIISVIPQNTSIPTAIVDGPDGQEKATATLPVTVSSDGQSATITTSADHVTKGENGDPNYYFVPKGSNVVQNPTTGTFHAQGYEIKSNNDGTFTIDNGKYDNNGNSYPGPMTVKIDDATGTITVTKPSVVKGSDGNLYQVNPGTVVTPKVENGNVEYHADAVQIPASTTVDAQTGKNGQNVPSGAKVVINPDTNTKDVVSNVPGFKGATGLPLDADTSHPVLQPADDIAKGVTVDFGGQSTNTTADLPVRGNDDGSITVTKTVTSPDGKYVITAGTTMVKGPDGQYHAKGYQTNSDGTFNIDNANLKANDGTYVTQNVKAKVDASGNITLANTTVGDDGKGNKFIAQAGSTIYRSTKDANSDGQYNVSAVKVSQDQSIPAKPGQNSQPQANAAHTHVNDDGTISIVSDKPGYVGTTLPAGTTDIPTNPVLTPATTKANLNLNDPSGNPTSSTASGVKVKGDDNGGLTTAETKYSDDGNSIVLINTPVTTDESGKLHANSYPYDPDNQTITLPNVPIKDPNGNVIGNQTIIGKVDPNTGAITVQTPVDAINGNHAYLADTGTVVDKGPNGYSVTAVDNTAVINNANLQDTLTNSSIGTGTAYVDKSTGKIISATVPTTGGNQNAGYKVFNQAGQIVNWSNGDGSVNDNATIVVIDNAPYHNNTNVSFVNIYTNQTVPTNGEKYTIKVNDSDHMPVGAGTSNASSAVESLPNGYMYAQGRQIIVEGYPNNDQNDTDKKMYIVPVVPVDGQINNATVNDESGTARNTSQTLPVHTNSDGSIETTKDVISQGSDGNYYAIPKGTPVVATTTPDGQNNFQTAGTKIPGNGLIDNVHFDNSDNASITGPVQANIDTNTGKITAAKTTVVTDPNNPKKAYQVTAGTEITMTKDANGNTEYYAAAQTLDQDKSIPAQVGNQGPIKDDAAHVHYNSDGTKDIVSDIPGFTGQNNLPNDYDTSKSTPELTPVDSTLDNVHVADLNGKDTGKIINNLPIKGQPDGSIQVTKPTITTDGRIILPGTKVTKDANGNWTVPSYPYDANSRTVTLPNTAINSEDGNRLASKDVKATIDLNTGTLSLASDDSKGVHIVDQPNSKAYQADDGTTITRNPNGTYSLVAKDDTAVMKNVTMVNDNNGQTPDKASQVIVDKTTGIILNATLPKTGSIANDGYKVNNYGTQTIDYKNPNAPIHVVDNAPISSSSNVKFINIYTGQEVTKPSDSTVTYTQRDGLPIYNGTDEAGNAVNKYPDGYNFVNGTTIQKVKDSQGNDQYVVSVYPTDGPMKADVTDANGSTQSAGQTLTVHTDDNHNITTTKDSISKGSDGNYYVVPKGTTVNKNQNPTSPNAAGYTVSGNKLPTNQDGTVTIDNAHLDNKDPKTGDVNSSILGSITANVNNNGDGTSNNPVLTVANTKVVVDPNDPSKAYQVDKDTPITVSSDANGNPQYHVDAKVIQQDQKITAKPGQNSQPVNDAAHVHYNSDGTKDVVSDIPGYQGQKGLANNADTSNETLTPVDDIAKGVHLDENGKDSGSTADLPVKGDDNGNVVVTKNTVSPDGKYLIPQNTTIAKQGDQNYHADALPINNGIIKINDANVNNSGAVKANADLDAKLDANNNLVTAHDQIVKGNGSDNNYYIIPAGSPITKDQATGKFNVDGNPIPINPDGTINISNANYDNKDNPSQSVVAPITAHVDPTTGQITVAKTSVVNTDDPKTVLKAPAGEEITITVDANGNPQYHVAATPLAQDVVRDAQAGTNGNTQAGGSTIHINADGSQTINSNVPGFTGSTIPDGQTVPSVPVLTPTDGVLNGVHVDDNSGNDTGKIVDSVPVRGQEDGTLQVTKPVETADHTRVILPTTNVEKDNNGNYHAPSYAYDPSTGIVTLPNVPIKNGAGDAVGYHDVTAKMDSNGNLTVNNDDGIHVVNGIKSYQADKGTPVTPDGKGGFYVTAQDNTVTLTNVPLFDDKTKKDVPAKGTVVVDKTTGHILDATLPTEGSIGDEGYHITDLDNQVVDIKNPLIHVTDNAPTADSHNVKFLDIYTNQLVPNVSGTVRYSVDDGNQPIFHGTDRAKEALITPVPAGLNYVPGSQIKYDASDNSYTVSVYPTDGIMNNASVVDNTNIPRANNQTLHVHTDANGNIYTTAPSIAQGNDGNYYYVPTNTAVNKDGNVNGGYAAAGNKLLTNPDGTVNIPDAHFDQVDSNNKIVNTVIHNVAANVNPDGTFSVAHITVVPDPNNPGKAYQVQAGEPITVTKDDKGNPVYHIISEQIDQDVHIPAQIGDKGKVVDGAGIIHVNPDGTKTVQSVVPGYVGPTLQPGDQIPNNPVLEPVNDTIKDAHFDHNGKDTGSIGDIPVIGDGKGNTIVSAPTKSADGKYLVPKGAQVTKDKDGNYHVPSYPVNPDGTITIDDARFNALDGTTVIGTVIAKVDKDGNLVVNNTTSITDSDGNTYTASAGTIIKPVVNDDGSTTMNISVSKTFAPIGNPEKDAKEQAKKKLPIPDLSKHNKRYQERYLAAYKKELAKSIPTYVYSDNGLYVHRDAKFTKKNRVNGYAKKPRNKAHVFKVLGFTLDANKYPRLKVKGGYISYNKHIHDAYYRTNALKTYRIIRNTGAWIHSGKHYTVKNRLVHLRRGQLVHVKKVIKLNGLTRFYLGNRRYFTSNKTYVSRVAPRYVYWTNQRNVYKVTHFSKKTVVRYVKARPRHEATAYKVLKTIVTKQGVKYKLRVGYVYANKTIEAYYRRPALEVRVIRKGGILIHTKKTFSRLNAIKHLKKGSVIRISELQNLNGITRFYIGNGKYITSNKTYVKRIK